MQKVGGGNPLWDEAFSLPLELGKVDVRVLPVGSEGREGGTALARSAALTAITAGFTYRGGFYTKWWRDETSAWGASVDGWTIWVGGC